MPEYTFRLNNREANEIIVVAEDIYAAERSLMQFTTACYLAWKARSMNMTSEIIDCIPIKTPKIPAGRDKV